MSSNIPGDLRYTKSHEWVRTNADGTAAGVFHHRPLEATLAQLDALFAHEQARAMR